jgi:DNA-binding response OmpR family regulator
MECGDERGQNVCPDLVLLDVNLPGKKRLRACRGVARESPNLHHLSHRQGTEERQASRAETRRRRLRHRRSTSKNCSRVCTRSCVARPSIRLLHLGDVTIDFERLKASHGADEIDLTHRDFEILKYLAERPNSIVSRNELLRAIWGYPDAANTRAVDHAIARLRKKIEDVPHKPRFIHTVHGDGYSLTVEGHHVADRT